MRNRISKARFNFLIRHPFLGDLSLRLRVREDPATLTMGTDMRDLIYNSEFVSKLSDGELEAVIAHEIAHCIFLHAGPRGVERMKERNRDIWYIACEFMANHFVTDLVALTLPKGCLYDAKYSDGSWTTESIYADLLQNAQKVPQSGGKVVDDHSQWGKGGGQDGKPKEGSGDPLGSKEMSATDQEWKVWTAQAAHNARRQGKLPAGLERLIGEILEPKLNWRQILAEFLLNKSKNDYSWRRPNKRQLWRGVYSPSLYSESINVGYAMDTSGSMGNEELAEGLGEIRGICSAFPSFQLHLFACDAAVHHYQELGPSDEVDIAGLCKGGGGTNFIPVFDKVRDDDIKIDALIYFTDAYGSFPEQPEYPVLWVVKGRGETPWGKRIDYEE